MCAKLPRGKKLLPGDIGGKAETPTVKVLYKTEPIPIFLST